MKTKIFIKITLFSVGLIIISGLVVYSGVNKTSELNNIKNANILKAANSLLNSFSSAQKEKVIFDFTDDERTDWHYVPRSREGIAIKELNTSQYKLLKNLLNEFLSSKGVEKTEGVITLENVLYELSGRSSYRDPGLYYICFFGTPRETNPWGWRIEGHHLSLNFTVFKDSIFISTPLFLGANPAEVNEGKYKGLRVLKFEEDYARELVTSFNEEQLKKALFDEDAPGDIVTGNDERVDPLNPKGISAGEMKKQQRDILFKLISEYINNSTPEQAKQRSKEFNSAGDSGIFFAWAGSLKKGEPHYYRIQSDTFLIEYDNTQNGANHIHSVWRSFNNDFGTDLLKKHYKEFSH